MLKSMKSKQKTKSCPRVANCYVQYQTKNYKIAQEQNPGLNHKELMKLLGTQWKNLPDEEKELYKKLSQEAAREAKENYQQESNEVNNKTELVRRNLEAAREIAREAKENYQQESNEVNNITELVRGNLSPAKKNSQYKDIKSDVGMSIIIKNQTEEKIITINDKVNSIDITGEGIKIRFSY